MVLLRRAKNSLPTLASPCSREQSRSLYEGDFSAPTSACAVSTRTDAEDLSRDAQAPLGTARSENSATGAGRHAGAEAMGFSPTAIIGLEGPLHVHLLVIKHGRGSRFGTSDRAGGKRYGRWGGTVKPESSEGRGNLNPEFRVVDN